MLRVATSAALYVEFPAWEAVTIQLPADIAVKVVPLTEQADEAVVKVTVRPELEEATNVWVPLGIDMAASALKVIV